jgi:hypothetical protein
MADYLNQEEVAARWDISERTLEAWRRQRRGPPYLRIGHRVRYRLADIEAFEAAVTVETTPRSKPRS